MPQIDILGVAALITLQIRRLPSHRLTRATLRPFAQTSAPNVLKTNSDPLNS